MRAWGGGSSDYAAARRTIGPRQVRPGALHLLRHELRRFLLLGVTLLGSKSFLAQLQPSREVLDHALELGHAQIVVHHIGLLALDLGLHGLGDCGSVHWGLVVGDLGSFDCWRCFS